MTKLYPTKNDLNEKLRRDVAQVLNRTLASALDLGLHAKQAHWNVKGPDFFQLHELFDKVYDETTEWTDLLAERTVQLGAIAEGTVDIVGKRTELPAYSLELSSGRDHVDALSRSLAAFGKSARAGIDTAQSAGDANTADLFTEISRGVDKMLWFVEAHLQAER